MTIRRHIIAAFVAVVALFTATLMVSAQTSPGQPDLRIVPAANGFQIVADNIAAPGAVGFDVFFFYDESLSTPTFVIDSGWTTFCPGMNGTVNDTPNGVANGATVSAACLSGAAAGRTGSNIPLGVVTFAAGECTATSGAQTIDLDTGTAAFGSPFSNMSDPQGAAPYFFTEADFTNDNLCNPTAVTIDTMTGESTSNNLVFPALAALAGLIIAGGLALRLRKR